MIDEKVQEGISMAQKFYDTAIELSVKYGFQVLGGLIILLIGVKLAQFVAKLFTDFLLAKHVDVTLTKFLAGILKVLIVVFTVIIAMEKFGVTISPLIAAASALIFGASFAIQAPLSNYAAGLSVILTRPFVVGNTITVAGVGGVVREVKLACTVLETEDGELITVPNKDVVGQVLWNSKENKVVELTVGISYHEDPDAAARVILAALAQCPKVTKDPVPQVGIQAFGESSIDMGVRYWVPTREYYQTLYAANAAVFRALKEARISIPFPQREVRMLSK